MTSSKMGFKVWLLYLLNILFCSGLSLGTEIRISREPVPGVPVVKMEVAPIGVENNNISQNQDVIKSLSNNKWEVQIKPILGKRNGKELLSPSASPNLTPYQPTGWDGVIVMNPVRPTVITDVPEGNVTAGQVCYISFAIANYGSTDITSEFLCYIYDNGIQFGVSTVSSLPANNYVGCFGFHIFNTWGVHTIKIIADATGVVTESNESDNTYTRTKSILAPNLVYYQPSGWDSPLVISSGPPNSLSNVKEGNIFVNQTCFINGAITNNGTGNVSGTFYAYFYDNGYALGGAIVSSGLAVGSYAYATGIPYVFQYSGAHPFSMVADSQNYVTETSETDNTYNRTKVVLGPPTAPTNLSAAVVSNTQIKLNWTDNSDNESGFGIDYKVNNGNWQGLTYNNPNVTILTHTGLTPGNEYCYRVYAFNNFGLSGYSNENCAIPWVWDNAMGDFDSSDDTTYWAFETPTGVSGRPSVAHLVSYQGHSGILQFGFSTSSQGIKLTSIGRFTPNLGNPWYHLKVIYYSDSPSSGHEILPAILLYSNFSSNAIKELGATYTGNSLIQSGSWYTFDSYVYCHSSSGLLQFFLKNRGSSGDMYIDSIDLTNENPPALSNSTSISFDFGDFDVDTDTTNWAFENAPNVSNGQPSAIWLPDYSGQTGVLGFSFSTSNQGVKMTSRDHLDIPVGKNAVMSFKAFSDLSNPSALNITGYQYAQKDSTFIWDIGAYASAGILPGNTWTTYYVPLTSSSQSTYRLQFVIKNSSQYPESIYLDDIQVFYDSSIVSPRIEEALRLEN